MPETRRCPQCGAEVRPDAPEGLCPQCLLKQAMKSESEIGHEPKTTATHGSCSIPPSLEEVGRQFPQLEILELLGQGGMGIVYKARQPRLDRLVALKILPPGAGRDPNFAERFTREARALAKLTHPSIVTVYDFGESDGRFYLLMEFVDGVNLRHLLREHRLKPEEALKIVSQICEALQYAHEQGVVHRDIKPENILLDKKGHVKIADFGLAKLLGPKAADSALTGSQQIMGTLHYMAPEQMERPLTVDHRADIYSLGVVFYEMLTGELPLGRFAPPSQKVQIDVRLDEVVLRALEKEPEKRYQHASDVKTEVESITTRTPSAALKAGPEGVSDQVLFRRVTILTLLGVALWNLALAALNWAYIARAEWYFRKEMPYDWLQTLWWFTTLVCLGYGSWWFYLLVKRPGTPRNFQDYLRVWRTYEPRVRPAWKPVVLWFGVWFAAEAYVLWRYGFEENIPFLWVMQAGLGLTPPVLMAVFWVVVRRNTHPRQGGLPITDDVKGKMEGAIQAPSRPQRPPVSDDMGNLPLDAKSEELERLVLSLMPDHEIAAIRAYRERMGVPLDHAAEAVEAIARRHGIAPRPVPVLNKPLMWLLGMLRPEHQETIAEQTAHVVSRIAMAILLPSFVVGGLLGSLPESYALLGTFACIVIAGFSEGLAYITSPTFAVHKRLLAALTIASEDSRDQTLATIAKDAAEVKATGVVMRGLAEMRNQTLRDETASACALTLARFANAAAAMQLAIMIQDKTRREAVLSQVATHPP
jgi:tRNA A-37 threonylcarbamoyl transferase component Bud32